MERSRFSHTSSTATSNPSVLSLSFISICDPLCPILFRLCHFLGSRANDWFFPIWNHSVRCSIHQLSTERGICPDLILSYLHRNPKCCLCDREFPCQYVCPETPKQFFTEVPQATHFSPLHCKILYCRGVWRCLNQIWRDDSFDPWGSTVLILFKNPFPCSVTGTAVFVANGHGLLFPFAFLNLSFVSQVIAF